jgi:hypothetical protein
MPAKVRAETARTSSETDLRVFVCRVDVNDEIIFVNDAWCEFAAENGAPDLTRERVTGHSLWECIHGRETRHLMEILFFRVRALELMLTFPFRCDSPVTRRDMSSTVRLLNGAGAVEIISRVEHQEPLPAGVVPPAGNARPRMVTICGWCRKIRVPEKGWVEVEQAIADLDLFGVAGPPSLTHGMCPDCEAGLIREVQALPADDGPP